MRIGVDARELAGRATGVGRYLGGLLQQWSASPDVLGRHEFVLFAAGRIPLALDARRFPARIIEGSGGTWWEQVRLPRAVGADHLDVWFSPAYTAPLATSLPTVVAIHDVSFAAHPEWFRFREGVRRRWLTRRSAEQARAVITISEFSRRQLVEQLDVPDGKIHVIPPGLTTGGGHQSPRPTPSSASTLRMSASPQAPAPSPQSSVPSPHRVLYVGSIFNRRHVIDLIRAFAPIARAHAGVSLDLVGDNRSYPREDVSGAIAREGVQAQIRWHEYATEEQLRALYAQARAFAFLSEYEGLGLTPLEALASGAPPVLLDTPVARESCGDAAIYVPLNDLRGVTHALESALFDEALRTRVLAAAPASLARYSWPRAARDTLTVLERAGQGL